VILYLELLHWPTVSYYSTWHARYGETFSVSCWIDQLSCNIWLRIDFRLTQHNSKDPVGLRRTNCAIPDHEFFELPCPKLFQSDRFSQPRSVNCWNDLPSRSNRLHLLPVGPAQLQGPSWAQTDQLCHPWLQILEASMPKAVSVCSNHSILLCKCLSRNIRHRLPVGPAQLQGPSGTQLG